MKHPFSIIIQKKRKSDARKGTLNHLAVGRCGIVMSVEGADAMQQRLRDIGIVEGTTIVCVGESPMRDPRAYLIRGCVMALRQKDGNEIAIQEVMNHGTS